MSGDNASKLMFGCSYWATTVKFSTVYLTWGRGQILSIPREILSEQAAHLCFWTWSILHGHYMTTFGEGDVDWNLIIEGLSPIWSNDYFLFFSMPTWMSYGNTCVAPVRLLKSHPFVQQIIFRDLRETVSVCSCAFYMSSCALKIYILSHLVGTGNIYRTDKRVMPLILFNWTDDADDKNEYLRSLGVFYSAAHHQSARTLATSHQL